MLPQKVASLYAEISLKKDSLEKGLKDSKSQIKDTGDALTTSVKSMGLAFGTLGAAAFAAKKAFDFAKEGAQLGFVSDKFDRLSGSIGTTSDALLIDLRKATKGIYSDAQLMQSATDFISLGFAKTSAEASRLATVAGGLNMNMNQLVLTLANKTTMRFDQLGVKVEGFEGRLKKLQTAGMSVDDAFKEAFLQQAEEQLALVGNAADSDLGSFMRLEAGASDLFASLKVLASDGLSPVVKYLGEVVSVAALTTKAMNEGNLSFYEAYKLNTRLRLGLADYETVLLEVRAAQLGVNTSSGNMEKGVQAAEAAVTNSMPPLTAHHDLLLKNTIKADKFASSLGSVETATDLVAQAYQRGIEPTDNYALANDRVAIAIGDVTKASLGKNAIDALNAAMKTMPPEEYEKAMRFLMGSMLDMTTANIDAQIAIKNLGDDLAKGKINPEQYAAAMWDLYKSMNALDGKKVVSYVDVYTTFHEQTVTSPGSSGGSGTGSGTFAPGQGGAQHGADFIVPQGYPNDTYNLPVTSGEHVQVTPANEIGTSQPININVYGSVTNDNIHALARAVGAELQRQARYN